MSTTKFFLFQCDRTCFETNRFPPPSHNQLVDGLEQPELVLLLNVARCCNALQVQRHVKESFISQWQKEFAEAELAKKLTSTGASSLQEEELLRLVVLRSNMVIHIFKISK